MDYEQIKQEVSEIASIAASVPEPFREKCFELLLNQLLAGTTLAPPRLTPPPPPPRDNADTGSTDTELGGLVGGPLPLQAQIRVFMSKTSVTEPELSRVVMFDSGQLHFIREPSPPNVSTGQIEWALMLALKNAFESNRLEVDPEAVRSICQEKGYYDKKNFSSNFKKAKSAALFRSALEPQGDPQPLTSEGIAALGKLVKSLAGPE